MREDLAPSQGMSDQIGADCEEDGRPRRYLVSGQSSSC